MRIYLSCSDGSVRSYDGMDLETVTLLISDLGLTATELTESEYNAAVAAVRG